MFTDPRSYKSISPLEALLSRNIFLPQHELLGAQGSLSFIVRIIFREQQVKLRVLALPSRDSMNLGLVIQESAGEG